MTIEHPSDSRCEAVEPSLAEFAFGMLEGRERAAVLSHLEGCSRCRAEVEQLSTTADALLRVAPEIEPPVGFEVRLFERLGVQSPDDTKRGPRRSARPPGIPRWTRALLATAAAVVVAVVVGFGTGFLGAPGSPGSNHSPSAVSGPAVAAASLTSGGTTVGTVSTFAGSPAWLVMKVHDARFSGKVWCEVVLANGERRAVGSFRLTKGYGAWDAPLSVNVHRITSARLVDEHGSVVASARLAV